MNALLLFILIELYIMNQRSAPAAKSPAKSPAKSFSLPEPPVWFGGACEWLWAALHAIAWVGLVSLLLFLVLAVINKWS